MGKGNLVYVKIVCFFLCKRSIGVMYFFFFGETGVVCFYFYFFYLVRLVCCITMNVYWVNFIGLLLLLLLLLLLFYFTFSTYWIGLSRNFNDYFYRLFLFLSF
jgi:hypothetical protein